MRHVFRNNVKIRGHASGLGAIRHRDFAMACGEMDEVQFTKFLTDACRLLAEHSTDGAIHFVCMDWRHIGEMWTAGLDVYSEIKNVCVWAKHNAGIWSMSTRSYGAGSPLLVSGRSTFPAIAVVVQKECGMFRLFSLR